MSYNLRPNTRWSAKVKETYWDSGKIDDVFLRMFWCRLSYTNNMPIESRQGRTYRLVLCPSGKGGITPSEIEF